MKQAMREYIAKRCEKELINNYEYARLEESDETSQAELQIVIEETCYKAGFRDAMAILKM